MDELCSERNCLIERQFRCLCLQRPNDRNAGVEFFDSPNEEQAIYDAYVIDCVPERNDLGSLQMMTSTTKTDEVRALLDEMLASMGLSTSRKN